MAEPAGAASSTAEGQPRIDRHARAQADEITCVRGWGGGGKAGRAWCALSPLAVPLGHGVHWTAPIASEKLAPVHKSHVALLCARVALLAVPFGHSAQATDPRTSAYVPAPHGRHSCATSPSKGPWDPVGHSRQLVRPVTLAYVPGGHMSHWGAPTAGWALDGAHGSQWLACTPLALPGRQGTHEVFDTPPGVGFAVPAGHRSHADGSLAPTSGLKVPTGHSTGSVMPPLSGRALRMPYSVNTKPSAQKAPAGHTRHDCAPWSGLYEPRGHGSHASSELPPRATGSRRVWVCVVFSSMLTLNDVSTERPRSPGRQNSHVPSPVPKLPGWHATHASTPVGRPHPEAHAPYWRVPAPARGHSPGGDGGATRTAETRATVVGSPQLTACVPAVTKPPTKSRVSSSITIRE